MANNANKIISDNWKVSPVSLGVNTGSLGKVTVVFFTEIPQSARIKTFFALASNFTDESDALLSGGGGVVMSYSS